MFGGTGCAEEEKMVLRCQRYLQVFEGGYVQNGAELFQAVPEDRGRTVNLKWQGTIHQEKNPNGKTSFKIEWLTLDAGWILFH